MTGYYEPYVCIQVNSLNRDNGDIECFDYYINNSVLFNKSNAKSYFMRIENVMIPKTFYDIDGTNNRFRILEYDGLLINGFVGDMIVINIPHGNYTIIELLTQLETELDLLTMNFNDYTLTYDDITNKISFLYSGVTSINVKIQTIESGSTLNEVLGFGKKILTNQTINGNGNAITDNEITILATIPHNASYEVDLDTKSYVIIETDITSNNFFDKHYQKHIGVIVPMTVDRNQKQYYANHNGHMTKLNNKNALNKMRFKLLDEYGNTINLRGINWSFELNIYQFTEIHKE